MEIKNVTWKYYEDGRITFYHDQDFVPGTDLETYIELLFDNESISADERDWLFERYVRGSPFLKIKDGSLLLEFQTPELSSPLDGIEYYSDKSNVPNESINQKTTSNNPPPPPPPKPRAKPKPRPKPPTPSPVPNKLYRYSVPFFCTKNSQEWICMVQSKDKPQKFEQAQNQKITNVEVSFLIDTSGSMTSKMEAVKRSVISFAKTIENEGANVKIALTGYGIGGGGFDRYTTKTWKLTSPSEFQNIVNKNLEVGLCGTFGCNVAEKGTAKVFKEVVSVFSKSSKGSKSLDTTKFIIHISDEYDYRGDNPDKNEIISICKSADAVVHTMGVSEKHTMHNGKPHSCHEEISTKTGGKFWDIVSTSGVADLSEIISHVSKTIAYSVSLLKTSGKVITDGPECEQFNSSPKISGGGSTRTAVQELKDNEGYMAIHKFDCMCCNSAMYYLCNYCGAHNCRGAEKEVQDEDGVVAESTCAACGKTVKIREASSVQSSVVEGPGGKKGK